MNVSLLRGEVRCVHPVAFFPRPLFFPTGERNGWGLAPKRGLHSVCTQTHGCQAWIIDNKKQKTIEAVEMITVRSKIRPEMAIKGLIEKFSLKSEHEVDTKLVLLSPGSAWAHIRVTFFAK